MQHKTQNDIENTSLISICDAKTQQIDVHDMCNHKIMERKDSTYPVCQ